jgi:dihydroorotase
MGESILIKNGRVIDPETGTDEILSLFLKDGRVSALGKQAEKAGKGADTVLDADGCWVMPGLIDMHVHLRDPGQTWKEDVASGSKAAAAGGFTTIVAMPNTRPVMDSPDRIDYVRIKAENDAPVHVLQAGAVTKGQKGEELADIDGMAEHGIPAVSEDGKSVMNAALYLEGMKKAAARGIPVLAHCEDADLVRGGCVNEDENSRAVGLPGISNTVEDVIVARDILLAREAGVHLHLCHCSTRGSAEMLRLAKKRGLDVSGEVCPHHFTLTSHDMILGDTNYKMNPPLRTEEDRQALLEGLKDGTFEVISTDHAPHAKDEKATTMRKAPFGIVGLETAVALTVTELVETGILTPLQMAEKMSRNPAKILHLKDRGSLAEGAEADVVILDPETEYRIDAERFLSRGRNTPFHGRKVKGKVLVTICGGKIVYQDRERNLTL